MEWTETCPLQGRHCNTEFYIKERRHHLPVLEGERIMTDFATYTNAQLNRWAAEMDGWKCVQFWSDLYEKYMYQITHNDAAVGCADFEEDTLWLLFVPKVANSSDLAIALLSRWGYEWRRVWDVEQLCYVVEVYTPDRKAWRDCNESPDCDTARALVIAACSLKGSEADHA
jgi:hypothetical protein